jgi:phage gpG-like protein
VFQLEIKVTEDTSRRVILQMIDRVQNMTPVYKAWAKDFARFERELFDSQGASGGVPWAPLAASTLLKKIKAGQNPAILRVTDALMNSLTRFPAPGGFRRTGKDQFQIGTLDKKAVYHQQGTRNMPARPVVVFTTQDKVHWAEMLEQYITTGRVKSGD